MRVPGGFRRRVPAPPGRGVPRPRAFRPHLLQPGAAVGEGDPTGRPGDGVMHRGRSLRAGDVRRDGDREGHRHDLPRGPATRAGGNRRGGHRRGPRRRGCSYATVGGGRPLRPRRRARAGHRPPDRAQPGSPAPRGAMGGQRGHLTGRRRDGAVRRHPGRRSTDVRRARGDRPPRRRLGLPRVQGPLRGDARHRLRAPAWATRSGSSPTTGSCSASPR